MIFAGLSVVLLGLDLVLTSPVASVAAVAVWGGFASANVPPLQAYVVRIAREVAPEAVDVASGLNIGAFNRGIALGAWIGGLIVEGMGLAAAPYFGALIVAMAIALTRLSGRLDTPVAPRRTVAAE